MTTPAAGDRVNELSRGNGLGGADLRVLQM